MLFKVLLYICLQIRSKNKKMKNNLFKMTPNQRLIAILVFVGTLLLVPLVAMQLTEEVKWDLFDFLIAGVLLAGTGLACEVVLRLVTTPKKRILICGLLLFLLFLVWAELAVGIFNTRFAGS